jgi:hypothetical protein
MRLIDSQPQTAIAMLSNGRPPASTKAKRSRHLSPARCFAAGRRFTSATTRRTKLVLPLSRRSGALLSVGQLRALRASRARAERVNGLPISPNPETEHDRGAPHLHAEPRPGAYRAMAAPPPCRRQRPHRVVLFSTSIPIGPFPAYRPGMMRRDFRRYARRDAIGLSAHYGDCRNDLPMRTATSCGSRISRRASSDSSGRSGCRKSSGSNRWLACHASPPSDSSPRTFIRTPASFGAICRIPTLWPAS